MLFTLFVHPFCPFPRFPLGCVAGGLQDGAWTPMAVADRCIFLMPFIAVMSVVHPVLCRTMPYYMFSKKHGRPEDLTMRSAFLMSRLSGLIG